MTEKDKENQELRREILDLKYENKSLKEEAEKYKMLRSLEMSECFERRRQIELLLEGGGAWRT